MPPPTNKELHERLTQAETHITLLIVVVALLLGIIFLMLCKSDLL
jgi:hypothetical protein